MEILIFNHSLYTAGVETLMVRMANWLVDNGHGCSIVLRHAFDDDLRKLLRPAVGVRIVGDSWELLAIPGLGRLIWNQSDLPTPDVVYTLEQSWAYTGLLIRDLFHRGRTVAINGAYHPNQFCYEGKPLRQGRVAKLRETIYNRYYPDEAKFFMSQEVCEGHERYFDRPMKTGFIWPLPLEIPSDTLVNGREMDRNLIISVGRFSPFKTYNHYMPYVIRSLRDRFPKLRWIVYGFGPEETKLMEGPWKEAIASGVMEFRGMVPYSELQAVLARARAFVGMGTALLEAGAMGVPSVPASAYDEEACSYGYLTDLPYYTCGEPLPDSDPTIPVENLLARIFSMNPGEYAEISQQHRDYMAEYSIERVMNHWLTKVATLQGRNQPAYPIQRKLWYLFARSMQIARARFSGSLRWS